MNEKYIISYKNYYRGIWDGFVLVLSVWNAFFIPLDISFKEELGQFFELIHNLELFIDLCFVIDIIVMFFTSY